ncbi:hypothetical protein O9993_15835 [Vibrio lentus]|nr:hypothetical protein [Vibrio lentus]
MGPTTVNDAFFRFVTDLALSDPIKRGGKYLILPPGYEGEVLGRLLLFRSPPATLTGLLLAAS